MSARGCVGFALALCAYSPSVFAQESARTVSLVATGDLLVHRRVVEVATHQRAQGGLRWMLQSMHDAITEEDIAYANLESPLTERVRPPANSTPPVLGAPEAYGEELAATGFDLLGLANNHAFDQGGDGLASTLATLSALHVATAGAGVSEQEAQRATVVTRGPVRVAFVSATDRMNNGPAPNRAGVRVFMANTRALESALERARLNAEVVVLAMHWSRDFAAQPTAAQRALARQLVRWGADVILGTGPHILQSVERLSSARGDAVCAYSLGNLLSNQGYRYRAGQTLTPAMLRSALDHPGTRDVVLLRVGLTLARGRIAIAPLTAHAFWNSNDGDDLRLVSLTNVAPALRQERAAAMARALGPSVMLVP
ncbi:MAG: CapA family protein [Deltaproteobacteria bacterium]|nr:CapA family protein [Deltaproteobacteria bacterium]